MNSQVSARDIAIARRVAWARQEKLNERAVNYARKYTTLDESMLHLISAYEDATELPAGDIREQRMREAWDNVIRYVRMLRPTIDSVA